MCDLSVQEGVEMRALQEILECHHGLQHMRIALPVLGSHEMPLVFPSRFYEGLEGPLRVEISTSIMGCYLALESMLPFSKHLTLEVKGPLHVQVAGVEMTGDRAAAAAVAYCVLGCVCMCCVGSCIGMCMCCCH